LATAHVPRGEDAGDIGGQTGQGCPELRFNGVGRGCGGWPACGTRGPGRTKTSSTSG
jgi:hypothetical protein